MLVFFNSINVKHWRHIGYLIKKTLNVNCNNARYVCWGAADANLPLNCNIVIYLRVSDLRVLIYLFFTIPLALGAGAMCNILNVVW